MACLKRIVPLRIKVAISSVLKREKVFLPSGKIAFVFLAADYGNIGDLAIAKAQEKFVSEVLPGYEVVRVPISKTRYVLSSIKSKIKPGDVVTIVGGGNMGSLYDDIEVLRQLVIRSFLNNRVICFPQSLDWDDGNASNRAISRIVKVYSSHSDMHLFAREKVTYEKLCSLFEGRRNVKLGCVPDIVLSADYSALGGAEVFGRTGIVSCFRDDKEKKICDESMARLLRVLGGFGHAVTVTDTHVVGAAMPKERCDQLLASKIMEFRKAKLVVTDRLHGMILAVIAGTPCLAISSINHKTRQTWKDWLSNCERVEFCEDFEEGNIMRQIDRLLSIELDDVGFETRLNLDLYLDLRSSLLGR